MLLIECVARPFNGGYCALMAAPETKTALFHAGYANPHDML
jgi:hypothetical protein